MNNSQIVDVIKTLKKTELVFPDGSTITIGKADIKIEPIDGPDELISIISEIREIEYRVLYSSATLNKQGTSTATELREFWENNNFFFEIGSQTIADGRVEFRADLPVTIGFPAIGSIYVVEKPTLILGIWKQHPSGFYLKDADTGSLNDWRKLNTKSRYTSNEFRLLDAIDQSKQAAHDSSLILTGTTRTFKYPDESGVFSMQPINVVDVNSLADFPTPSGGFIKPENQTIYNVHGFINIGTNGFDFTGINAKIQGNATGADGIISTTTGNFIKGLTTFGISFEKLRITAMTCDKLFNIVGTGIETFSWDSCIAIGGDSIGEIDTMNAIIFTEFAFTNFGGGFLIKGSNNFLLMTNAQSDDTQGTYLDLGTATFNGLEISSSTILVTTGNTGIAVLSDGANINIGGQGILFGVGINIAGGGTPITGYSPLDLKWNAYGNSNIITSDRITPTGWGRYSDDGSVPLVLTTTPQLMTINGLGSNQDTGKLPKSIRGSAELYISPAITPISESDSYDLSIPFTVTAKTGGVTEIILQIDEGVGGAPTIVRFTADYNIAKTPPFEKVRTILITASANMMANGGRIFLSVDTATATISLRDILISRNSSGAS